MKPTLNRRIRTVQYDDQRFSSTEIDLLHTPALQRLYDLHQLGLADRVFIDASHSRLHHVVGVVEQADRIMRAIIANLDKHPEDRLEYAGGPESGELKRDFAKYVEERILAVRLMGMLHDLTHAPYGHTLEDEIELVDQKHDEPARQADAFYRLVLQYFGWIERNSDSTAWGAESRSRPADDDHEGLLTWYLDSPELNEPPHTPEFIQFLAKRWSKFLRPRSGNGRSMRKITPQMLVAFLKDLAFAMRALLYLDLAHKEVNKVKKEHVPEAEYPVDQLLKALLTEAKAEALNDRQFIPQRDVFLLDVIGNTICADLLDYARRDAANAGLRLDYDPQRIVDTMTIVSSAGPMPTKVTGESGPIDFPFSDACLRTCISIYSHKLRTDVPGELLNLLQVRYYVYERMLYHPTKCVAGAILGAAIQFMGWERLPAHWRFIGDQVFQYQVAETARLVRDLLAHLPANRRLDPELVKKIHSQIDSLPRNGVGTAAKQLLEDRLLSLADVSARLRIFGRLRDDKAKAGILAPYAESNPTDALDDASVARVTAAIKKDHGDSKAAQEAIAWITEMLPTVGSVRNELKAGLRLLDRLGARRYLKITFRLLPNASVRGLHANAAKTTVADFFKKPLERKIAEREIERRANLPPGSVVIHCPPEKGPQKIAKILISTAGRSSGQAKQPKIAMLNSIKAIDPEVFAKHEEAIKALEDMYASTWRLAVSIAPPHDANWEEVNRHVGHVLLELITGSRGEHDTVVNDEYTVQEIRDVETSIELAEAAEAAEPGVDAPKQVDDEQALLIRLGEGLRQQEEFASLPTNASRADIEAASKNFQKRIWGIGKKLEKRARSASPRLRRSKDTVREEIAKLFDLESMENTTDDRMTKILSRATHLNLPAWEQFSQKLSEFRPPNPFSANSISRETRDELYGRIETILTDAETEFDGNDAESE